MRHSHRSRRVLLAVVMLAGCHAYWTKALRPAPDLQLPSGPAVYMHSLDAGTPHLSQQLEVLHGMGLEACPKESRSALEARWSQLLIDWEPRQTFADGTHGFVGDCQREVNGCQVSDYDIEVDEVAALPDEAGHGFWETCFGRTGETDLPDGGIAYDAEFAAWVTRTRAAMMAAQ